MRHTALIVLAVGILCGCGGSDPRIAILEKQVAEQGQQVKQLELHAAELNRRSQFATKTIGDITLTVQRIDREVAELK